MKTVILMGAGAIGSRHLQALKAVRDQLDITVIDPIESSLKIAEGRFNEALPLVHPHRISFVTSLPASIPDIDIAIIATRSDMRREAVETLLSRGKVHFMILEKLLFTKKQDYADVEELLTRSGTKAFVNCTMRNIPFYRDMKNDGKLERIVYQVGSGETGLVTSVVHFLDHMAYLTDCLEYSVDLSLVNPTPIESKRKPFLEFLGTIRVTFNDGSTGIFTRYPSGTEPSLITITNDKAAYIIRETEEKTWVSKKTSDWKWGEIASPIPLQSVMTTWIVEELLKKGTCRLSPYSDSAKIHLPILEALREFLNVHGGSYDHYPFT